MNWKLFGKILLLSGMISMFGYAEQEEIKPPAKKIAIFTANRAEKEFNEQMPIFEDMLIAQISDLGFEVISREVVLSAVGDLLKKSEKNKLDALLDEQTSTLRLSQNLGADYILFATFMGMDRETRHVNARGVEYDNYTYTLRASCRILDGNTGASLTANMVEPSRTIQQTKYSQTVSEGVVRELLGKASKSMSTYFEQKNLEGSIRDVDLAKSQVGFGIVISLNEVNFPQAEIDSEGHVNIIANKGTVQPLAVSVELDGLSIGTTGSGDILTMLKASPGIHRIRLVRDDLVPFERMINIHEGMKLNISMQLNKEGRARWKENTVIFTELLQQTKLNDAEVEMLRGHAQKLRQSGYKVDLKMDTDENITIKKSQSLMNQEEN